VLLACDRIAEFSSAAAGAALARGFASRADVAVAPLAVGGQELAEAYGVLADVGVAGSSHAWAVGGTDVLLVGLSQQPRGWVPEASSGDVGRWVAEVVADSTAGTVAIDLTGITAHDGGAGLLAELGSSLQGRAVLGIVAFDDLTLTATGVTGGVARRAYAAGVDVAEVLAADTARKAYAEALGVGLSLAPGGGAAGGCGLAILSLGGRLVTGPQFCHLVAGLEPTLAAADLVVTGCTALSALDRGGPVVAAVVEWAERAQRPCVAFAGGDELSRRELRTFGLEAGHHLDEPITEAQLELAASRVAHSWFPNR
jgi:glycerate 2-kinase